jgi:hypothetical protein
MGGDHEGSGLDIRRIERLIQPVVTTPFEWKSNQPAFSRRLGMEDGDGQPNHKFRCPTFQVDGFKVEVGEQVGTPRAELGDQFRAQVMRALLLRIDVNPPGTP